MPPSPDQLLDDDDLAGLRRAAALVHTVGRLRVDVATNGTVRARVDASTTGTESHPAAPGDGQLIDACGFRLAVSRAWRDHRAGRDVALIGGRGPVELLWRVPPPGADLGFGAIRTTCGGRFVWAFASLLAPTELAGVLGEIDTAHVADADPHPRLQTDALTARLATDDLLGATVVHVDAVPTDLGMVRSIDEVMRGLLAVVAAAECVSALAHADR